VSRLFGLVSCWLCGLSTDVRHCLCHQQRTCSMNTMMQLSSVVQQTRLFFQPQIYSQEASAVGCRMQRVINPNKMKRPETQFFCWLQGGRNLLAGHTQQPSELDCRRPTAPPPPVRHAKRPYSRRCPTPLVSGKPDQAN
jgi:hypothetical protein